MQGLIIGNKMVYKCKVLVALNCFDKNYHHHNDNNLKI